MVKSQGGYEGTGEIKVILWKKDTVFDFTHLEKMSAGDKEFEADLIDTYLEDMRLDFKVLRQQLKMVKAQKL